MEPGSNAYYYGQLTGDFATTFQGLVEMGAGYTITTGGTTFGIVTSPTGIGAVAGGAVAVGGVAVTTHGGLVAQNSVHNILFAKGPPGGGKGSFKTIRTNKRANKIAQEANFASAHEFKATFKPGGKNSDWNMQLNNTTGELRLIRVNNSSITVKTGVFLKR